MEVHADELGIDAELVSDLYRPSSPDTPVHQTRESGRRGCRFTGWLRARKASSSTMRDLVRTPSMAYLYLK